MFQPTCSDVSSDTLNERQTDGFLPSILSGFWYGTDACDLTPVAKQSRTVNHRAYKISTVYLTP